MLTNPSTGRKVTQGNTGIFVDDLGPNGSITVKVDDAIVGVIDGTGFSFNQTPMAPTATTGDNSTKVATTAFVTQAVADVVGGTGTANSLTTARQIALAGDVSGSTMFDGSANVSITATLPNVNTTGAGTYTKVTVNAKGLITSAASLSDTDVTTALGFIPLNSTAPVSTNTGGTVVRRDGSGNFAAGTITAALAGNAATATKLAAPVNINGTPFDGSANVTISDTSKLPLTGGTITGSLALHNATMVGVTLRDTNATVDARQWGVYLDDADNAFVIGTQNDAGSSTPRVTVSRAGAVAVPGSLTVGGSAVWTAATFNPALKADLASPALTGTPTTPTAAPGTNTTQIASTAFVKAAVDAGIAGVSPDLSNYAQLTSANTFNQPQTSRVDGANHNFRARGAGAMAVRVGTLAQKGRGTTSSPTTIQTGDIVGVYAVGGYNSTIWTDGSDGGGEMQLVARENWSPTVGSAKWRFTNAPTGDTWPIETLAFDTDAITWRNETVWHSGNFTPSLKANLASPVFTGTPQAPTPSAADNSTRIATTAYVQTALEGVTGGSDPDALTNTSVIDGGSY